MYSMGEKGAPVAPFNAYRRLCAYLAA